MAVAVALAVRGVAGDRGQFYGELLSRATQEEFQWLLRVSERLSPKDSLAELGSGLEAQRSVVTAITCFAVSPESYRGALARALALGNDTDTVMSMAGAISGAHLGFDAVPKLLLSRLENDLKGRDYLCDLAKRLLHQSQKS